jgi:hypothetical protein
MITNIPPKASRENRFSPALYRGRDAIERMFCRLKDFRRIATRYNRLAVNFLAAACIAATVSYTDPKPVRSTPSRRKAAFDRLSRCTSSSRH